MTGKPARAGAARRLLNLQPPTHEMASFNRVILLGNLTRDIELRYTPQGTAVTDIGLAVNDRVKRNDQWVDEATFVDITLWGRTAEVASEYLGKGSQVLIEGRLKLDTWEKDGKKNYKLRVIGERMQMLGSRRGGQESGNSFNENAYSQADDDSGSQPAPPPRDNIPF